MPGLERIVALSSCMILACGGTADDLEPGAGNSAGTGTSTLLVRGDIQARPRVANASAVADFDTHLSVRVSLNDQPVTTGEVTVTSRRGSTALVFRSDDGKWDGTMSGYDEVYVLDVASGEHLVEGVRVDGPDIHAFTAPLPGATLDSTTTTRIAWRRQQTATATIDTDELDRLTIPDTGEYVLAAGALKADREKPRENTLELVRANRVTPAGGVAGSDVTVSVENRIQVLAQANPNL
jgi:hypothetical protein